MMLPICARAIRCSTAASPGSLTRLAVRYTVAVVPGVSSLTACAAAAATPLVQRDETLSVIPAGLPEDALASRLAQVDAAAIIKLGRHFPKLRRVLAQLGLLDGALYVERASLPNQRIAPLATIERGERALFRDGVGPSQTQRMKPVLPKGAAVVVLGPGGAALGRRVLRGTARGAALRSARIAGRLGRSL